VVATLPPAVTPTETLYLEVVRPLVPKAWTGATDDGLLQIGYSSCELLRTSDGDRVSALAALSRVMVGKPAEDVTFAGYAFTAAEQVLCPELRR